MLYRDVGTPRAQDAPERRTRRSVPPIRPDPRTFRPIDQQMISFKPGISLQGRDRSSKIPRPCVGAASGLT